MQMYPPQARARVAHAMAARELADAARAQVTTRADRYASPGSFVEEALRLRGLAGWVLERAVVLERERGTTWEDIGEALGDITRQSAQARYGAAHQRWKDGLVHPWQPHSDGQHVYCVLPDGAEDPDRWAADLDAWSRHHAEDGEVSKEDQRPVSDGLDTDPYRVLLTERFLLSQQARDLQARRLVGQELLPSEVDAFHARRQAMIAWIDATLPTVDPALVDLMRTDRASLEQLVDLVPLSPTVQGTAENGSGVAS